MSRENIRGIPPSERNVARLSFRIDEKEARIFQSRLAAEGNTMQFVLRRMVRRYCGLREKGR